MEEIEKLLQDNEMTELQTKERIEQYNLETSLEICEEYFEKNEATINQLKSKNKNSFEKMKEIANQIEDINFKIIDELFFTNASRSLKKDNFVSLEVELQDKELDNSIFEALKESSNHYFSEELLLTLPLYWKDISTSDFNSYQEAMKKIKELQEERTKLIDKFYKLHDKIIVANTSLSQYEEIFFELFPKDNYNESEKKLLRTLFEIAKTGESEIKEPSIDMNGDFVEIPLLIDPEAKPFIKKYIKLLKEGEIPFEKIFQLATKGETDYFVTFDHQPEKRKLIVNIKKERNTSSSELDISKKQIEKLEDTIKQLQKQVSKNESQLVPIQSKFNFKDIASKTQSVSMYKPHKRIFLDGEKMKEIFEKSGSVSVPFGLMENNRKEVEFKFTKLNHRLSSTSQKIFNACCSAQYIMQQNSYPINETIIEEETLYQLWKGDKTFSKKPSSEQLIQMKNEILGMSSNISKLNFSKDYNYLDETIRLKYTKEGSFLPIHYETIEIERENGQKYRKNCYIFDNVISIFDFFQRLQMVNTAPLEIESILKSSTMNDYISELMKEEISQLYYFKNSGKAQGNQKKVYITNEGEELSPKEWNERKTKEGKLQGFWRYSLTRTIESLIEDYKTRTPNFQGKNKQRFIESLVVFLRESTQIEWKNGKYIESFVLYDNKGNIVEDEDFVTNKEKTSYKKTTGKKGKVAPKNTSIQKIEINIT